VGVQGVALTEGSNDSKVGRLHAGSHEEDEVLVASLPEGGHIEPEGLKTSRLVFQVLHVKELYSDIPVPVTRMYSTEATTSYFISNLQLFIRYVPFPDRHLSSTGPRAASITFHTGGRVLTIESVCRSNAVRTARQGLVTVIALDSVHRRVGTHNSLQEQAGPLVGPGQGALGVRGQLLLRGLREPEVLLAVSCWTDAPGRCRLWVTGNNNLRTRWRARITTTRTGIKWWWRGSW
jgi:hypothetical protein